MPGYSWDPYSGTVFPKCCDDECSYAYDPGSGEQFPAMCADPITLPDYVPNPGQCVCEYVPPAPPTPPQNLQANQSAVGSNKLTWNPVFALQTRIYRSEVSGGPYTFLENAGAGFQFEHFDNTAVPGVTYFYVVTRVEEEGESAYSNEASVMTRSELEQFFNNMLAFNPDMLVLPDIFRGVFVDGQPVPLIPSDPTNLNNLQQSNPAKQPLWLDSVPALNGHAALKFDGVDDFMEAAFPGATTMAVITVFCRDGVNTNTRIAGLTQGSGGPDATPTTPISHFFNADTLGSHYAGSGPPGFPIADTAIHISTAYLDGAGNCFLNLDNLPYGSSALSNEVADAGTFAAIGGIGSGLSLNGKIAFQIRWRNSPPEGDLGYCAQQVRAFYGLP